MAYRNLLNETLVGATGALREADAFMRFRDFVCARNATYDYSSTGIGTWTVIDSSYNVDEDNAEVNDWYVLYSPGVSGNETLYFYFKLIADDVEVHMYQYWSASGHSGSGAHCYRAYGWDIGPDPEYIWIYGDEDYIHMAAKGISGNTNWYSGSFGLLETNWLTELEGGRRRNIQTVTNGGLTAGSAVTITVSGTTTSGVQSDLWRVGNDLIIMDRGNLEKITVLTNDGIDTITADLSNSYTAGQTKIAVLFPYMLGGGSTTYFVRSGYCTMIHWHDGRAGDAAIPPITTGAISLAWQTYSDPGWNGAYQIMPFACWNVDPAGGYYGNVPHAGWVNLTGLSNLDLLDDITVSGTGWRYVSLTNARVYREVS